MRKFVLLLALLGTSAHAEVIAESNNKGGGKMALTNETCRDNSHKLAYSVVSGYPTLMGCWSSDNSHVHIKWYDNDLRSYPLEIWTLVPKATM
jgi:hypothetical protein